MNTLFSSSPKKTTPSLYSDSVDISRLTDLSILLVDPNIASRHAVKSAIAHSGATKIREITDGNSVRLTKMVSSTVWDIIVCEEDFAKGQSGTAILDALREEGALSHRTIFMIMSNLATHERVVLAAENVADDFLQKKWLTPALIEERILSAVQKKTHFMEVFDSIYKWDRAAAIRQCEDLITRFEGERQKISLIKSFSKSEIELRNERLRSYVNYAKRLQAEQYLRNGQFEKAHSMYSKIVEEAFWKSPIYWAEFGMGESLLGMRKLEEAEKVFSGVLHKNSDFVRCYERLSEVYELSGEKAKAIQSLSLAKDKSPLKFSRIETLAHMALDNDDLETAEKSLLHIVNRGMESKYRSPKTFSLLAKVQILSRDEESAKKTLADMNLIYRGNPKTFRQAELSNAAMQAWMIDQKIKKARDNNDESLVKKLSAEVRGHLAKFIESQSDDCLLDPELVPDFVAVCLRNGNETLADNLILRFLKNPKNQEMAHKKMLGAIESDFWTERIREALAHIENEVEYVINSINRLMKSSDWDAANHRASILANEFSNDTRVLSHVVFAKFSILRRTKTWNEKVYTEAEDLFALIEEKRPTHTEYSNAKLERAKVRSLENLVPDKYLRREAIPSIPFVDGVTNRGIISEEKEE